MDETPSPARDPRARASSPLPSRRGEEVCPARPASQSASRPANLAVGRTPADPKVPFSPPSLGTPLTSAGRPTPDPPLTSTARTTSPAAAGGTRLGRNRTREVGIRNVALRGFRPVVPPFSQSQRGKTPRARPRLLAGHARLAPAELRIRVARGLGAVSFE